MSLCLMRLKTRSFQCFFFRHQYKENPEYDFIWHLSLVTHYYFNHITSVEQQLLPSRYLSRQIGELSWIINGPLDMVDYTCSWTFQVGHAHGWYFGASRCQKGQLHDMCVSMDRTHALLSFVTI